MSHRLAGSWDRNEFRDLKTITIIFTNQQLERNKRSDALKITFIQYTCQLTQFSHVLHCHPICVQKNRVTVSPVFTCNFSAESAVKITPVLSGKGKSSGGIKGSPFSVGINSTLLRKNVDCLYAIAPAYLANGLTESQIAPIMLLQTSKPRFI